MKPNIFVFTGELCSIDRIRAALWVWEWGDEVDTKVTERTTYLVVGADPST